MVRGNRPGFTKSRSSFKQVALGLGVMATLLVSGCGKTAFNTTVSTQTLPAPGYFNIPPKVDILLFVDDSGSMKSSFSVIQKQVPAFLNTLESENWDYHFASNPLTRTRAQIPQVAGSAYDPSYSSWLAPYPGAQKSDLASSQIVPSFFRSVSASYQNTAKAYSDFLTANDVNSALGDSEPGFSTIREILNSGISGTGFLRKDSLLLVMVMGNGDDNSGVSYAPRPDGVRTPSPTSQTNSFNEYLSYFQGFCQNGSKCGVGLQFHAAVNTTGASRCLYSTGSPLKGTRYMNMASNLGGGSYNFCTQDVSTVLTQLGQSLKATKVAYETDYLILKSEPNVDSIKVTKYLGGNTSRAQVISNKVNDPEGWWTYVGYVQNLNISKVPKPGGGTIEMNPASGYAIQLHGNAVLTGSDSADVDSKPAGATTSVSQ